MIFRIQLFILRCRISNWGGGLLRFGKSVPFFQRFGYECPAPFNGAVVVIAEQFSGGGKDVVPLLCAVSLTWSLVCHFTEKLSCGVLTATVIPVVVSSRDEILTDSADDVWI